MIPPDSHHAARSVAALEPDRDVDGRPACPVCEATATAPRYRLAALTVWACALCGLVFQWPLPSEEEIRHLFAELYRTDEGLLPELRGYYGYCFDDVPSNPLVQLYERWLDRLERLKRPGRLLDVGCGTGLFLAVARRRGWTPFGVDDSVEATRYAREHFGLPVVTDDFEAHAWGDESFDAITMWDIIEHARRPVQLIAAARRRLAADGVVALGTPNQASILESIAAGLYRASGRRISAPLKRLYVVPHFLYFTDVTLTDTLCRGGLAIIERDRDVTDLRRLDMKLPMRLVLSALFRVARLTGGENRLFAIAGSVPR
jgi:SAM-dependent methyltransferase